MLVLSRKKKQTVCLGTDIVVRVLEISGSTVKLGIEAPREISILRGELEFEKSHDLQTESATLHDESRDGNTLLSIE